MSLSHHYGFWSIVIILLMGAIAIIFTEGRR
jgi:hypothetical protein